MADRYLTRPTCLAQHLGRLLSEKETGFIDRSAPLVDAVASGILANSLADRGDTEASSDREDLPPFLAMYTAVWAAASSLPQEF